MIKRVVLSLLGLLCMVTLTAQTDKRLVIDDEIQLLQLQDSIFIHVTWHHLEGFGRFSSNGMIVISGGKALMIDTPMDNDKTERLTRFVEDTLRATLTRLIIGHFHDDCLGGLGYLQGIGIESVANYMTTDKCREIGLPVPSTSFTDSLVFNFNGLQIECRYFGAGHTVDNITVWIPDKNILFGGCLVKSVNSRDLGNLSDAVVTDWDLTIRRLLDHYPEVEIVVPGHGDPGGVELLHHTISLVEMGR
jgi:metallo-beta-lactamase class B